MRTIHRCDPCGRLVMRKPSCARCAAGERALASAAGSELAIRAVLYPPRAVVEVLGPARPAPASMHDQRVRRGTVLAGRYALLERIGSGGTATVYRAQDSSRGGEVALKILRQALSDDEVAAERFKREARQVERLRHPNIVRTFEHGISDDVHYIAMELVPGRSLKSLVAVDAPLEPGHATEIVLQILQAARFTHDHGIVHRDLKPGNVILDRSGQVKVTDFGLACTREAGVTPTGSLLGTVEYVAPERLMGEPATEACDIYAIGVILYELVTGRRPFDAELVSTIALKHIHETPSPPRAVNRALSPGLSAIIMRALEKAPSSRFPDAGAFAAALRREAARMAGHRGLASAA